MPSKHKHGKKSHEKELEQKAGMPGGGVGRREEPGRSGIYPFGSEGAPENAPVREAGSWGRSDYAESGTSELDLGREGVRSTADRPGGAMNEGPADRPSGPGDVGGD